MKTANAQTADETAAPEAKPASKAQSGDKPTDATVGGKPDENDSRARWINETYDTTVRYVPEKKVWEEVDNKTGRVNWVDKEMGRTGDYVELFSPERKAEIRLLDKRMEQQLNGKWSWVANGRWDAAPVSAGSP